MHVFNLKLVHDKAHLLDYVFLYSCQIVSNLHYCWAGYFFRFDILVDLNLTTNFAILLNKYHCKVV